MSEIRKILEKSPCIQCDGSGGYPVDDGHGGCVEEQCQFCWELRFPFIDKAEIAIDKILIEKEEKIKSLEKQLTEKQIEIDNLKYMLEHECDAEEER